jgi:hypothetical protein
VSLAVHNLWHEYRMVRDFVLQHLLTVSPGASLLHISRAVGQLKWSLGYILNQCLFNNILTNGVLQPTSVGMTVRGAMLHTTRAALSQGSRTICTGGCAEKYFYPEEDS